MVRLLGSGPACEDGGQELFTPYGYVFDDPILHKDPDGRFPILTAIGGAIGKKIGTITESSLKSI
jgi:hypothetical protein